MPIPTAVEIYSQHTFALSAPQSAGVYAVVLEVGTGKAWNGERGEGALVNAAATPWATLAQDLEYEFGGFWNLLIPYDTLEKGQTYQIRVYQRQEDAPPALFDLQLASKWLANYGMPRLPGIPPGATPTTLRCKKPDGTLVADADTWVTIDAAGRQVVSSAQSRSDGTVTHYLNAGVVYRFWFQKDGYRTVAGEEFTAR